MTYQFNKIIFGLFGVLVFKFYLHPLSRRSLPTPSLETYSPTPLRFSRIITSLTMKISSLFSALVMTLAGLVAADSKPHGICGVDHHTWSRTWTITLTDVWDDHARVCKALWAELAGRK